ncbi:MAG TPA: ribokinase [Candidatus Acidoferrum sp.]|nr:ribokinase [Candidatus Acidoferrum sp.]
MVKMNRKPIVVVGSINIDLVARAERIPRSGETVSSSDFQMHPGGKGANQAVAVARLGYPVRMIGRVGSDAFAEKLRAQLTASGVDASLVLTSEGPSGVAMIAVAAHGENAIVVTPGANAQVSPEDVHSNARVIREAGAVLTQLEIPFATVECLAGLCAQAGVPLLVDPAPARALPAGLLEQVSWLTPNETEITECFPTGVPLPPDATEMAGTLSEWVKSGVVLKMGARGAFLAGSDGLRQHIRAFPVRAVDTTAAGDAFNGAFAVGLMLERSPVESARFAAAASAVSVTRAGAAPSMPTMEEVDRLWGESGRR